MKMWVFLLVKLLVLYYQKKQSLSLLSKTIIILRNLKFKNNNNFKELEVHDNSIKYPKSSLRCMNKLNKEDYTTKTFRQQTEQNLITIKNEGKKRNRLEKNLNKLNVIQIS